MRRTARKVFTWRKEVALDLDEAAQLIEELRPFRLRGSTDPCSLWAVREAPAFLGALPPEESEELHQAEYVVMSYNTPIAWVIDGQAVVPDIGYTPTTGQHQYLAAHALGVPFRPGRGRRLATIDANATQYGRPRRLRRGGIDGPSDQSQERTHGSTEPMSWSPAEVAAYNAADDGDEWGPGHEHGPAPVSPGWHSPAHP